MAEHHAVSSQYYDTPLDPGRNYLDVLRMRRIPPSAKDLDYEVPPEFANRPDLLAGHFYSDPAYWWVFMTANMDLVQDPNTDLPAGAKIRVPDPQTVLGLR